MSTLRVNTLQNVAGTGQPDMAGAAKAWVNFNGTGTVAIRAQFNVSSITDNGTGDYTVNFTNAMADVNYGYALAGRQDGANCNNVCPVVGALLVGSMRVQTYNVENSPAIRDYDQMSVQIFR